MTRMEHLADTLLRHNTHRLPRDISITPEVYEKYLLGHERELFKSRLIRCNIAVECEVVGLRFIHYNSYDEDVKIVPHYAPCYSVKKPPLKLRYPYKPYMGLYTGKALEFIGAAGRTQSYVFMSEEPLSTIPMLKGEELLA